MKKDLLKQAFETIAFQSKSFGKELQLLLSELRQKDLKAKDAQDNHLVRAIELLILDKTGININLKVDTDIMAAVELPALELNHIFFDDFTKYFIQENIQQNHDKFKEKEILIFDLQNSKIHGPVAKIPCELHLSWNDLLKKNKFTDEEVTAVALHELGHIFTTFEYLNRLSTTNQALASVVQEFLNKDKIKYQLELKRVSKKLFNDEHKLDNLKDSDNPLVISSLILSTELKRKNSDLGTPYYDSVSCEYMADQFVARHFYGHHLVSGLDKLYPGFSIQKSKGAGILLDILLCLTTFKTFHLILNTAVIAGTGVGGILFLCINLMTLYLTYTSGAPTLSIPTYDDLLIRYKRVKEQIILDLKNKKYDQHQITEKINNLDIVEKYITATFPEETIVRKLITRLVSKETNAKKAIQLQRDLEELASNGLFVQSAKLRTMLK